MSRVLWTFVCLLTTVVAFADEAAPKSFVFHTRWRDRDGASAGTPHAKTVEWDPKKTAVVVCDMWDKHWCEASTRRVGEMAPRMNETIKAARAAGALVIHCPSDTMDFYKDTPQRRLAIDAPKVETRIPLERWCRIMPDYEGALPIDDADGGCDPPMKNYKAWSRQIADIEIHDQDAITDSPEAFYLMKQRGIENVLVMGVHTNMCVLGRPFSIRQMVRQGMNVLLARDLTDSMYNPEKAPQTTHVRGTELVIEHIERWWCPTITSVDLIGGSPNRFTDDKRKQAVLIVNDNLYFSPDSLAPLTDTLTRDFDLGTTTFHGDAARGFRGLESAPSADLMILYARRQPLTKAQKEAVEKHLAEGRPLVAFRTASHAFSARGDAPAGLVNWNEFDADVLGGSYHGHGDAGATIDAAVQKSETKLLDGVAGFPWNTKSDLYRVTPLAKDVQVLLTGKNPAGESEPVAWTRTAGKSKVFYTSLGHAEDFANPDFRRFVKNAIEWALTP